MLALLLGVKIGGARRSSRSAACCARSILRCGSTLSIRMVLACDGVTGDLSSKIGNRSYRHRGSASGYISTRGTAGLSSTIR